MNFDLLKDYVNRADDEIGRYQIRFILSPSRMQRDDYKVANLSWQSIQYGEEDIDQVPDDKRGIYAFVVNHNNGVLPEHGYVLYIGIAGRRSDRSLRERYKDYLNERKLLKREKIARMVFHWHDVLRFYFAPVDEDITSEMLEELEEKMNTALLPPFSVGDLEAETKRMIRAFS